MNDFGNKPFSFGKIELGVVDDEVVVEHISVQNTKQNQFPLAPPNVSFGKKLNNALQAKSAAVSLLEDLRIGRMSRTDYCTIRDALELLAEIVEGDLSRYNQRQQKQRNNYNKNNNSTLKNNKKKQLHNKGKR